MLKGYKLRCIECGKEYHKEEVRYVCTVCSKKQRTFDVLRGVLEVVIEIDEFNIKSKNLMNNPDYINYLHKTIQLKHNLDYPVGNTPLLLPPRFSTEFGFKKLFVKNEGKNPTNSLKDRASILVVADALSRGENRVVTASTGNAASSLAGVCAYANIEAIIFVPSTAPIGKLVQIINYGATVVIIDGTYDDAFELSLEYSKLTNSCNRNTAYNPMTSEGKKSVAIELYIDLGFKAPDVVFVPVGDGSIISGVAKGFKDLKRIGCIKDLPKLIGVQAEGSDAIMQGFESGIPPILKNANTIADSISVSAPRNGIRAIKDIKESKGYCIKVSDKEIMEAQFIMGKLTGIFSEPAASSVLAGFIKEIDKLDKNQTIILLNTGDGLKDIKSASMNINIPPSVDNSIDSVINYLGGL